MAGRMSRAFSSVPWNLVWAAEPDGPSYEVTLGSWTASLVCGLSSIKLGEQYLPAEL